MTQVQRCSIIHSLVGRNIVLSSKTGSGKTLSYLIPLIENLYRDKWSKFDGLGGLIICPTRELCIQVFEVIKLLLKNHELNVTAIYGGKKLHEEQKFIKNTNILIATPGRLLQHLEETIEFYWDNLKLFIIDEADEIMDLGFENTMKSIIEHMKIINNNKQIILLSATLGKSTIGNKFGLENELKNAEFILLNELNKGKVKNLYEIPIKLEQYYIEVSHDEKLNKLFSFLKSHKKSKVLVFVSTCKQVRFIYESFKKLRVGNSILELHGKQKQNKRTAIYLTFLEKNFGFLITTNIASRGLDFPNINWVIQYDCPENIQTYIHRIGRTARHKSGGRSLLFLDKSEKNFYNKLESSNILIKKIGINPNKKLDITNSLKSILSENNDIKYLAQKAFINFIKNIYQMSDKSVFDISKLNGNLLAKSFGLVQTPVIKIGNQNDNKNIIRDNNNDKNEEVKNQPILNKQQRKLLKLKEKIKNKSKNKIENVDDIVLIDKNIGMKMEELRKNPTIDRTKNILEVENDEEEFLFKKEKNERDIENIEINNQIYTKSQLKKISDGGISKGKNIYNINEEGKVLTNDEYIKEKYAPKNDKLKDKSLLNIYGSKLLINEQKDKEMNQENWLSKKIKKKNLKKDYLLSKRDNFYN